MNSRCNVVSIWQPTALEAHAFIRKNELGEWFVQFLPDTLMGKGATWIVLNMPRHIWDGFKAAEHRPRLTVLE